MPTPHNAPRIPDPLRVLAVGDVDHVELRSAFELVAGDRYASLVVADRQEPGGIYELVLVFQARPGSIEYATVTELARQSPLAGVTVVLGTWCEGETRTGRPLPLAQRVFWYQFPQWWQHVRQAWSESQPTMWQQPPSAPASLPVVDHRLIAIDAPDADAAEALQTACDTLGTTSVWTPRWQRERPAGAPSGGIWVGGQLNDWERMDLTAFRSSLPVEAPLVVLLDFPRHDRVEMAKRLGATAVLGKPWRLEQLATALQD